MGTAGQANREVPQSTRLSRSPRYCERQVWGNNTRSADHGGMAHSLRNRPFVVGQSDTLDAPPHPAQSPLHRSTWASGKARHKPDQIATIVQPNLGNFVRTLAMPKTAPPPFCAPGAVLCTSQGYGKAAAATAMMKCFVAAATFASFLAMPAMGDSARLIGVGAGAGGVRHLGDGGNWLLN